MNTHHRDGHRKPGQVRADDRNHNMNIMVHSRTVVWVARDRRLRNGGGLEYLELGYWVLGYTSRDLAGSMTGGTQLGRKE